MYEKQLEAMERLFGVMDRLRVECPWDREQTFESLRNNTIEETFELTDAITDGDMDGIREELGDLLFALVNMARLYGIDPENALERSNKKFIRRFEHIEKRADEQGVELTKMPLEEMEAYWQEAKREER